VNGGVTDQHVDPTRRDWGASGRGSRLIDSVEDAVHGRDLSRDLSVVEYMSFYSMRKTD
jgi:hypothetical protein